MGSNSESASTGARGFRTVSGGRSWIVTDNHDPGDRLGRLRHIVRLRPRLYTSRYANTTLAAYPAAKVRITLGHPRILLNYQLAGEILELAPTRDMFETTEAEFAIAYAALLVERGGVEHHHPTVRLRRRRGRLRRPGAPLLRTPQPADPWRFLSSPRLRRFLDGRDEAAGAGTTGAIAGRTGSGGRGSVLQ
jgi:hypothetical protein